MCSVNYKNSTATVHVLYDKTAQVNAQVNMLYYNTWSAINSVLQ